MKDLREIGDTRAPDMLVFQSGNQERVGLAFDMVEGGDKGWRTLNE